MLDNRLQQYFPQLIQQIGWILILFGLLLLFNAIPMPNPFIPVVFIIIGLVLSLTSKGARLDLRNRMIKQYVGLLGIKLGVWKALPELNEIVFTSSSYSQQIHSFVSRRQLNTRVFRAFLKGPDYKLLFSTNQDPESVKQDVRTAAKRLDLPAIDYTVKPPGKI